MWVGVTSGLAGVKLSGSPKRFGEKRAKDRRRVIRIINPRRSLNEKYGWNEILSASELTPIGLFEPVSCRNMAWIRVAATTTNGSRK